MGLLLPQVYRPEAGLLQHLQCGKPRGSVGGPLRLLHSLQNLDPWFNPYTAKTQYRKFEPNIPRKGIARPFMCLWSDLYFPPIGLPILLQEICGPILGIYKSLTDT